DAVAAEDAPELVDDELHGEALVTSSRVPLGVLTGLDEDALCGARGGAAEACHAARVVRLFAERQAVHSAEALGIRPLLLRIADRADARVEPLGHGVGTLPAEHLLRVLEEVLHRHGEPLPD